MARSRIKILFAAVVLTLAVGYLAFAGVRAGRTYYLAVDPFLADPAYHGHACVCTVSWATRASRLTPWPEPSSCCAARPPRFP